MLTNLRAQLPPHDGDELLTPCQLKQVSLFKRLSAPPTFVKYPGAAVLRRYRRGETIVRQGDAGWTAFYLLTTEDLLALRQSQLRAGRRRLDRPASSEESPGWRERLQNRVSFL